MTEADRRALRRLAGGEGAVRASTDDLQGLLLQVVFALLMIFRVYLHLPRILGMIIALFLTISISYIPMIVGYTYVSGSLHMALDARMSKSPQN